MTLLVRAYHVRPRLSMLRKQISESFVDESVKGPSFGLGEGPHTREQIGVDLRADAFFDCLCCLTMS